jgi:hypothetical protein
MVELWADVGVALGCGRVEDREGRPAEAICTGVASGIVLVCAVINVLARAGVVEALAGAVEGRRGVTLLSLGVELKIL